MAEQQPVCERCQGLLKLTRTWRSVHFSCTGCGTTYPLSRFIHLMDEAMERQLAVFRCDRI